MECIAYRGFQFDTSSLANDVAVKVKGENNFEMAKST